MITVIVITAIACIALYALNKKGILPFVILFGLVGLSGSDFLYYLAFSFLATLMAFYIVNCFYSMQAWVDRMRANFIDKDGNKTKGIIKAVLAMSYGVLVFFTIGSIFGQYMIAQKIGSPDFLIDPVYQKCDLISNILLGINIVGYVSTKIWMFYEKHSRIKNHHST